MYRWLILLGTIAVIGSGCVRTINPALKDEQVLVDPSFVGTWVQTDADKNGKKAPLLEIRPADKDEWYPAEFTDEDGKKSSMVGRLGKIGDVEVIEFTVREDGLQAVGDCSKGLLMPLYFTVVIRPVDADHIAAQAIDYDWFQKYIQAHPDELQNVKSKNGDTNGTISASTEDFQKFLLKHLKEDGAMKSTRWARQAPATQRAIGEPPGHF